jgi:hypothetical protein
VRVVLGSHDGKVSSVKAFPSVSCSTEPPGSVKGAAT